MTQTASDPSGIMRVVATMACFLTIEVSTMAVAAYPCKRGCRSALVTDRHGCRLQAFNSARARVDARAGSGGHEWGRPRGCLGLQCIGWPVHARTYERVSSTRYQCGLEVWAGRSPRQRIHFPWDDTDGAGWSPANRQRTVAHECDEMRAAQTRLSAMGHVKCQTVLCTPFGGLVVHADRARSSGRTCRPGVL